MILKLLNPRLTLVLGGRRDSSTTCTFRQGSFLEHSLRDSELVFERKRPFSWNNLTELAHRHCGQICLVIRRSESGIFAGLYGDVYQPLLRLP